VIERKKAATINWGDKTLECQQLED
jgi:hypothetical protein